MFRRCLPVWVILSIVAGPSARAQMPFATNLIPARTSLERLGLERQWFIVVPLVETERLLRISRTEGPGVRPDELRQAARLRCRDRPSALDGRAGEQVRDSPGESPPTRGPSS